MELKFGIVEDINDPSESGRIKVRVYGIHDASLTAVPTKTLPWAQCMVGTFDGSLSGVGKSPTGIQLGQLVVVAFLDPHLKQVPLILGALNGINSEILQKFQGINVPRESSQYGFQQPIDETYLGQPDTNFQARSNPEFINPIHDQRIETQITGIETATGQTWDEPISTMDKVVYPNSKVEQTKSGHLNEIDDTEGNERILLWHKSGSFHEISNEYKLYKVTGDDFEIVKGNKNISVEGNLSITVNGNSEIYTKGNSDIKIDGNAKVEVGGTSDLISGGKVTVEAPEIELGIDSSEPMVMGEKLATWVTSELKVYLDSHVHTGNLGAPTSPPSVPFTEGTAASGGVVYSKKNKTQK